MTLIDIQNRFDFLKINRPDITDVCKIFGGDSYKVPDQLGSEFQTLIEYYKSINAQTIIEIGTYTGGSLWYWVKYSAANAKIISIDIDHSKCLFWEEFSNLRPDVEIIKLSGPSQDIEIIKQVHSYTDKPDFVFIDGCHYFPIVDSDWENYGKNAKVCAIHDIGYGSSPDPQDVRILWNKIIQEFPRNTLSLIQEEFRKATYGIGLVVK